MKFLRWGLACIVAALAILTAAAATLTQNTLRVPHRDPVVPRGSRAVTIAARDHVTLVASFVAPPQPTRRCVLALHGVNDTRAGMGHFTDMLTATHYAILLPDSRAHGASGGNLITYGLLEKYDAIDWTHWLRGQGCEQIYGLGESLGASILIQTAAVEPQFRAIVAECPYASLQSVAQYRVARMSRLPWWAANPGAWLIVKSTEIYARLVYGIDLSKVSPIDDMAHIATPVLLIHGERDARTPPSNSEALARANPHAELWLVPGADHSGAFFVQPEEFQQRLLAWFAQN